MAPTLGVVLPALDESEGIERAVGEAVAALARAVADGVIADFEVVVVDDGSTDGTGALVDAMAAEDDRIRLLTHGRNRGVGAALRTALGSLETDLVLYTDSDGPVDLHDLDVPIGALGRPDVALVCGRRARYGQDGRLRSVASRGYDLLVRAVLGVRARDVNFPFKLATKDLLDTLDLRCDGALVDVEMIALVLRAGGVVEQLDMTYHPRVEGESKTFRSRLLVTLGSELVRRTPQLSTRWPFSSRGSARPGRWSTAPR